MFIGHYGAALAAKKLDKDISLGLLFFVLLLFGIEGVSIAGG